MSLVVYLYISLPVIIFFFTWLTPAFAVPAASLVLVSLFFVFRDTKDIFHLGFSGNYGKLILALLIVALWVYLSGVQKTVFQNEDSYIRNGILELLVNRSWPVVNESGNGRVMLIYYIGFWLPSALLGKLFGVEAAYFFLYLWTVLGVYIAYLLICNLTGRIRLWPLFLFILFSGLDIAGYFIHMLYDSGYAASFSLTRHIEWWNYWQFSSFTTQLFWVFNQAVPAWVATLLVLNQKNNRSIVFIMGCLLLESTFPFVGLIPVAFYMSLNNFKSSGSRSIWGYIRSLLTFENVIGGGVSGIISFLYLKGNYSSHNIVSSSPESGSPLKKLMMYALFITLECLVYYLLVFRYQKKNPLYYISLLTLCLCPLIRVGYSVDFCMRASIPSLIVLYTLVLASLERMKKERRGMFIVLLMVILIGSVTPLFEMNRTLYNTSVSITRGEDPSQSAAPEEEIVTPSNFGGAIESRLQALLFDID